MSDTKRIQEDPPDNDQTQSTPSAGRSRLRRVLRRGAVVTLTGILGFAILFPAALFLFQRKLIYFPQRYQAIELGRIRSSSGR